MPLDIGSRLELMVDDYLIDRLDDGARLCLHHPAPREVVIVHDAPWEGSGCVYHSVFQDGNLYRMYYEAGHLDVSGGKLNPNTHPFYCCYAESDDGIHWVKPKLALHKFRRSKANNIVLLDAAAVFKDDNPRCPAEARYKAITCSAGPPVGLLPLKSPDGIHWSPMSDVPVITEGAFDSQNLAFWDPVRKEYRAYWRIFSADRRAIRTAASKDLLHWGPHSDLKYVDSPDEQLYTNQVKPYCRAPHIFIGFPTRYVERGWSDSMRALPEREHRELRAAAELRYGTALTEGLLMASHDPVRFKRWNEAFLRPGIERVGTWNYGQQYIAWHAVETRSGIEGAPDELSLYAVESYWTGNSCDLRRYTLRIDGFVSVQAPLSGGRLITRPLVFKGKKLVMNFSTSAAGSVKVEIQNVAGKPIKGFALADCPEIFGDAIERVVGWKGGSDVSRLAGKPIRLQFVMKDADLYSLRFQQ